MNPTHTDLMTNAGVYNGRVRVRADEATWDGSRRGQKKSAVSPVGVAATVGRERRANTKKDFSNRKTQANKDFSITSVQEEPRGQSLRNEPLENDPAIEATISSTTSARNLPSLTRESNSRPGAHAIPGVADEESILPSNERHSLTQPTVFWVAQSALLVDEAAEEERRQ